MLVHLVRISSLLRVGLGNEQRTWSALEHRRTAQNGVCVYLPAWKVPLCLLSQFLASAII